MMHAVSVNLTQVQPIVPMTVVQHRLPSSVDSESSLPLQHRVVDMPTMMVDTTDPLPQPESKISTKICSLPAS